VSPPSAGGGWRSQLARFKPKSWSWWTITGWLVSVVLAVYQLVSADKSPRLTVATFPLKFETYRSDFDTDFGFTFRGKPINAESVTSVKIAIWNDGNGIIEATDVLRPLQISLPAGTAILNATVTKASPDTGFVRINDPSDYNSGTCRLRWTILQPGDGAVIQLLYTGTDQPIRVDGSFKGQRRVVTQEYRLTDTRGGAVITKSRLQVGIVLLLLGILCFILFLRFVHLSQKLPVAKEIAELRKRHPDSSVRPLVAFAASIAFVVLAFVLLLFPWLRSGPPFGW
jgi:hypothetical protein